MSKKIWHRARRELQEGWQGLERTLESRYLATRVSNSDELDEVLAWIGEFSPDGPMTVEEIPKEWPRMIMFVSVTNVSDELDDTECRLVAEDARYIGSITWDRMHVTVMPIPNSMLENANEALLDPVASPVEA